MTKTIATITSAPDCGALSLRVIDGPRGEMNEDEWQHIAYEVALYDGDHEICRGPFRLGIGHVQPAGLGDQTGPWARGMPEDERRALEALSWQWARNPDLRLRHAKDQLNQAKVAAILAKRQAVEPKLADVVDSLLSDGSAFFDAQSFEDWAADYGFDTDSRKAEATYRTCVEIGRQLTAALGRERIDELRAAFQDY